MRQGKIKWYNGKKCFGFVAPETPNEAGNMDDVFVHSSSLRDAGIRFLNEGDVIKFEEEMRGDKLSATKIELVSRDEEAAKKFQERRSEFHGDRGDRGYDRGPRRDFRGGDRRDSRGGDRRRDNGEDGDRKGWAFWKK